MLLIHQEKNNYRVASLFSRTCHVVGAAVKQDALTSVWETGMDVSKEMGQIPLLLH